MTSKLAFFYYVRKYFVFIFTAFVLIYVGAILLFDDRYVLIFMRSAQVVISLVILFAFRGSIKSVWKDNYRLIPPEYWPEHVGTWGITIFWLGILGNGLWLLFWQLADVQSVQVKLAIANSAINGFFVLLIVAGGFLKFCAPPAYGGQLSSSSRNLIIVTIISTCLIATLGIFNHKVFKNAGEYLSQYILQDIKF